MVVGRGATLRSLGRPLHSANDARVKGVRGVVSTGRTEQVVLSMVMI